MLYYIVYKITNKINGKIYIGSHKTSDLDDGYFGSGKVLRYAIQKYAIENFDKTILAIFDNPKQMYETERHIVDESFVARDDTYNINIGGNGGFHYCNENKLNGFRDRCIARLGRKIVNEKYSSEEKRKWGIKGGLESKKRKKGIHGLLPGSVWLGRRHKEESKRKIGEKNSEHQQGIGNSNYGKCWMYSNEEQKSISIPKAEAEFYTLLGWNKGRKMKFSPVIAVA